MPKDWPRPVIHWDIQARDPAAARAFYSAMFDWNIGEAPLMGIPAGIGGVEPDALTGNIFPGQKPGFSLYIQVADLRTSMQQAKDLGGDVLSEPFDVPGGPTIAAVADPEGNRIVLVQQ